MIFLAALLATGPQAFYAGNELYSFCEVQDNERCMGYILGTVDTALAVETAFNQPPPFCFGEGVRASQVRDVVVIYLRDHPANRHLGAAGLIFSAVKQAFPCAK